MNRKLLSLVYNINMAKNKSVLKRSPLVSFLRKKRICTNDMARANLLISLSAVIFITALAVYFDALSISAFTINELPEGSFLVDPNGNLQQVVDGKLIFIEG